MPAEDLWASFFNVDLILSELHINSGIRDMVEVGCGYGIFTVPVAKKISGYLFAFDIEDGMLEIVKQKLIKENIHNVNLEQRDLLTQKTGLADNSIDYVLLFNILHYESPLEFINEAYRILKQYGKVGIIHWRSDIETPRGPDLSIRPKPEQILKWIDKSEFSIYREPVIIEPYHYGLVISKR
jgi:ubiquinone/menaquinone biosynthesis C-methylase UbiE